MFLQELYDNNESLTKHPNWGSRLMAFGLERKSVGFGNFEIGHLNPASQKEFPGCGVLELLQLPVYSLVHSALSTGRLRIRIWTSISANLNMRTR